MKRKAKVTIAGSLILVEPEEPRAIHEIKVDGIKLVRKLESAIESRSWASLAELANQLQDIAARGLHHESLIKAKNIAAFAMNGHTEPEPR